MLETFDVRPDALGDLLPALTTVAGVMASLGAPYFIVGAAARDLMLEHVHGQIPFRATRDVDVAVSVSSWSEYEHVASTFTEAHGFHRSPQREHRLYRESITIDLIPFGPIARQGRVEWPSGTATMAAATFDEVYRGAVGIRIEGGPLVPVASLPGVGILKLVAWGESPYERRQDPVDLCIILRAYDPISEAALYAHHRDLLDVEPFDTRVIAARLYGRDMGRLLRTAASRDAVLRVLGANTSLESRLAHAMGPGCPADYELRSRWIRALIDGIEETPGPALQARP